MENEETLKLAYEITKSTIFVLGIIKAGEIGKELIMSVI